VSFRNHRVGSWLGALSIALAAAPIVYIFHADSFPHYASTETVILLGGVGGSVLAALGAGLVVPVGGSLRLLWLPWTWCVCGDSVPDSFVGPGNAVPGNLVLGTHFPRLRQAPFRREKLGVMIVLQ
jgi:hypothetical protein